PSGLDRKRGLRRHRGRHLHGIGRRDRHDGGLDAGYRFHFGTGMKAALGLLLSVSLVAPPLLAREPALPFEQKPEKREAFFADVMVLYANNSKKGIDPRIGNMPELQKPPFSSYDSYELADRARLPLEKEKPRTLELPNGRVLRTKL